MEIQCGICSQRFRNKAALLQHNKSTGHTVCQVCHKVLVNPEGLQQHIGASHNWKCPQCSETHSTKSDLAKHQRRANHCYCGDCNKPFTSQSALKDHFKSSLHSTEFRCCDCDRQFGSSQSLEQHLRYASHRPKADRKCQVCRCKFKTTAALEAHVCAQESSKPKCPKCSRKFPHARALQQHLESRVHRPLTSLGCIGSSCHKRFSAPSELIQHLESGTCSSGMSRQKINELVVLHDTDRLITRPQTNANGLLLQVNKRLATITQDQSAEATTPKTEDCTSDSTTSLTPSWTPVSEVFTSTEWALIVSQSGTTRCPFCPPDRRPFVSELALQQHLQSAAHCEPFIFCPSPLGPNQMSEKHQPAMAFKTVSGLVQHLESGKCAGGMATFWKAISYLETRLEMLGLGMKLIP